MATWETAHLKLDIKYQQHPVLFHLIAQVAQRHM